MDWSQAQDGDDANEAAVLEGIRLRRAGRLAEAQALCEAILQTQPCDAAALHQLGLVRTGQSNYSGAADVLRAAVALRPQDSAWVNDLANALCQAGDLGSAIVHYETALRISPSFAECHYNLGVALMCQHQVDRAVSHYRSAIALDLRAPQVFYNLGVALQDQGKPSEAVSNYDKAIALKPDYAQAHYNCGNSLLHQGKLTEAVQRYEAAVSFAPDHVAAHHNLAMARMELGRKAEAVVAYRRVMDLQPDHDAARHVLAALEGANPERAPPAYVTRLFDHYAPAFDSHLVIKLGYGIPALLARVLAEELGPAAATADILDLGCGTGLFGSCAKPWCNSLVGVDLSPQMLAVAAGKSVYDSLVAADLTDYLRARAGDAFHALVAADVLCYLGDLTPLFGQAQRVCRPNGIFAFSVEEGPDLGAEYLLRPTGRFVHAATYIRSLAQRFHFVERVAQEVTVRYENGAAVVGRIFLFAKA